MLSCFEEDFVGCSLSRTIAIVFTWAFVFSAKGVGRSASPARIVNKKMREPGSAQRIQRQKSTQGALLLLTIALH